MNKTQLSKGNWVYKKEDFYRNYSSEVNLFSNVSGTKSNLAINI